MELLEFFKDDIKIFDYAIIANHVSIGRSDLCDIALPDVALSRKHCVLEKRNGTWLLVDRSRHGVFINGQKKKKHLLKMGEQFKIASYSIALKKAPQNSTVETTKILPSHMHEFVLESQEEYVVLRNSISIIEGVDAKKEFPIKKAEVSIGGKGCDIVLGDPKLLSPHCIIRLIEGRPMIQEAMGQVFVDGRRIRNMMPLYSSDQIRIADSIFRFRQAKEGLTPIREGFGQLCGTSLKMQQVFGRLALFAGHDFPILITGESGTGKELAAQGIHSHSIRQSGPFIAINCAAIPENLIESELFGYEKGAFTGSNTRYDGAFQQAHQGTLFLDEVGELSLAAQSKLLRVLESGEVRRVGAKSSEFPDVHIVAATNRDLANSVQEGLFRADLLFRLQVLQVRMPPLREHLEDLPQLIQALCSKFATPCSITEQAMQHLQKHHWAGNVRELRNVITRAYVLSGGVIEVEHIEFFENMQKEASSISIKQWDEVAYLQALNVECDGNRSAMARKLGIPRSTLMYKLQKAGLTS